MSPNRLANETSPYLRQHADNPVDWYPWGSEALDRARREDRPVLLSIGYAACHWCHVMAHESFENRETASLMNERFVNIKVDREERPDLDGIYMQAVQSMTGHGGWPMTVFLTPEGEPFFGGTYFPPEARHGLPAFRTVIQAVADAWRSRRDKVTETVGAIRSLYAAQAAAPPVTGALTAETLSRAWQGLAARFDARHGGFDGGGAPKFPPAMPMDFLLRYWRRRDEAAALDMVHATFLAMARGGLYDQVGGGFHRYAVDDAWRVPHFEKMLYDNALLTRLGVDLWRATGDAEVRRVTEQTLTWLAREMTAPDGGWHATLDADSEGEEGRFYVWTAKDFDAALPAGEDAAAARARFGVTDAGNFEGATVLSLPRGDVDLPDGPDRTREALFQARGARPRPARDDKIVASWNGLMLRAVAEAAQAFGGAAADAALGATVDLRAMALTNGAFFRRVMVRPDGRVFRSALGGAARIEGFLEDHAAVALGFLALYELTFDAGWLDDAHRVARAMVDAFFDAGGRAFYDTARDAPPLVTRPRDIADNATPSGTSLATELLLRLADLGGNDAWRAMGEHVLTTLAEPLARFPSAFGYLLGVADLAVHGAVEVAIAGDPGAPAFAALAAAVGDTYVPSRVMAGGDPANVPDEARALMADRGPRDGKPAAYVCRRYVCESPTTKAEVLRGQLARAGLAP